MHRVTMSLLNEETAVTETIVTIQAQLVVTAEPFQERIFVVAAAEIGVLLLNAGIDCKTDWEEDGMNKKAHGEEFGHAVETAMSLMQDGPSRAKEILPLY
jgi:hypothetical protein